VLTEVARVLARHGVAGRLGGDEFGLWVPGDDAGTAAALSEDVAATLPGELVTGDVPLGLSVGAAPAEGEADVMELMERADRALYAAKPGGRRGRRDQ
jgi:diguanylate cyclase (GGDEF)-like protein